MKLPKRKCKGCGVDIAKKHPNARFHSQKCKDTFWNIKNPRGKFAHLKGQPMCREDDSYSEPDDHSYWAGKDD